MSRRQLIVMSLGCCCLLTCRVGPSAAPRVAEGPHDAAAIRQSGTRHDTLADAGETDAWFRIGSPRVDARLARAAVTTVDNPQQRPVLRLDTVLLGTGDWLATWLRHCSMVVRQRDGFLLLEPEQAGPNRDSLRAVLRRALPPIDAAMARVRDDLRNRRQVARKRTYDRTECLIAQKEESIAPGDDDGVRVDFSQGPLARTNRAYDVALSGPGLFVVDIMEGGHKRRAYTRDGRFARSQDGHLVLQSDPAVFLSPRLTIPEDAIELFISPDGTVTAKMQSPSAVSIGRIEWVRFEHPERLRPIGKGLFERTPEAGEETPGHAPGERFGELRQFFVEQSNVDPFESWSHLCRLHDARQIIAALTMELDKERDWDRIEAPSAAVHVSARAWRGTSSTVTLPLAMPACAELEPTLLRYLRLRGVDAMLGDSDVTLRRHPRVARALVGYLQFLRRRLDIIAENLARAGGPTRGAASTVVRNRQTVEFDESGELVTVEDTSPMRIIRADTPNHREDDAPVEPQFVECPNIDVAFEMADSDAVSREYRSLRRALESMGSAAVGPLTDLLEKANATDASAASRGMARDAAWALGGIGPDATGAIPALKRSLRAGDWALRKAAATAAQRVAPESPTVINAIVEMWTHALRSERATERYEAAVALGRLGSRAASAIPALAQLADDPTSGAARALGRMGPAAAPAVGTLVDLLSHPVVHVRRQAADALGRIGPAARSTVPDLVSVIQDDEDTEVRWRSAAAIGMIGARDSGCLDALAEILRGEDPIVRDHVAEALGRLGLPNPDTRADLCEASRSEDPLKRIIPLLALALSANASTTEVAVLTTLMFGDRPDVRVAACRAMGKLGRWATPAVAALKGMVQEEDDTLASAAIEALGAIGPGASDAVGTLSIALVHPNPLVCRRAARALGRIGPAAGDSVPALMRSLNHENERIILAAAQALGRIGPQAVEAADALRVLQRHHSAAVRNAASTALAGLAPPREARLILVDPGRRPVNGAAQPDTPEEMADATDVSAAP